MNSLPSPPAQSQPSFFFSDDYLCRWGQCEEKFNDAEVLYEHVKNAHVGRKAQHNLCLDCMWENCTATFTKRDHITSHVRVHVDLKPFSCVVCKKPFKRPQDLKKHEKIHSDDEIAKARVLENNENANGTYHAVGHSSSLQPPYDQRYQPLSPESQVDRSPSMGASTISTPSPYHAPLSPYHIPMSPASTADSEAWSNPGLASPFSTGSDDLFNSPRTSNLEADMMYRPTFGRPNINIDVSGTFFGTFPVTSSGLESMTSPQSAKRGRDDNPAEDLLRETFQGFVDAKKVRVDAEYDPDMAEHLNALRAILEITPMTPSLLAPAFDGPEQVDQFSQYVSDLYENVSGETYEPQSFLPLFPGYDQKQDAIALDATFVNGLADFNPAMNSHNLASSLNFTGAPVTTQPQMALGSDRMLWGTPANGPVIRTMGTKSMVQSANAMEQAQYVSLPSLMKAPTPSIKSEPQDDPKVKEDPERTYIDVGTQTKAKQDGGVMMMMQRPADKQKQPKSSYEGKTSSQIMMSAPAVPDTPLPELDIQEVREADQVKEEDQAKEDTALESPKDTATSPSTSRPTTSGRYSDFLQTAKAKQAEAAAAAAAAAATKTAEPLDPIEAMTRQLAQTRLDPPVKIIPSTTRPVTEGDVDRQIKAAKARALCENDPVRKHHAEVVLTLLKSIDELMAEHRKKVAVWKDIQTREASGTSARNGPSSTRSNFSVHNQDQIRTVSSFLSSRPAVQSSSVSDYDSLHSNLADLNLGDNRTSSFSDIPVEYPPMSDQPSTEEEFELTEEERRYIEEDTARIAEEKRLIEEENARIATAARVTPGYVRV